MKYSILMPYYKRDIQLLSTLSAFSYFYRHRRDYEIILIEDIKNNDADNIELKSASYAFDDLNIKIINGTNNESFSPATNYNIGAGEAKGEFLILTNPEGMHAIDILQELDNEFAVSKYSYIICSCLSVENKFLSIYNLNNKNISGKWYQHSIHRNTGCHFCSAISKENYLKIGGFSEEFSAGTGYDDDDFRNKVQQAGIPFVYRDDLLTLHLFHEQASKDMNLFYRNKKLYHDKWGENAFSAGQLPLV